MGHKIIHVLTDTNVGGAGILLTNYLKNHNRDKYDIVVVLPKNSAMKPFIDKLSVRTIEIDGIADKSFSVEGFKALREVFKVEKPSIVHTHAALSARLAGKLGGFRIVHTRHSVRDVQGTNTQKDPLVKRLISKVINNYLSDIMIATSPVVAHDMKEDGIKPHKIKMIYNGVDPVKKLDDEEIKILKKQYGISDTDFVCSIVARLEIVKGHKFILEAAKILQDVEPDVKFIIAGVGSLEQELKQMAKDKGISNCIFIGFVDGVEKIYNVTDIGLNASYSETSNQALIEGMSLGIPSVASSGGGNPYVVEDGVNGIITAIGDGRGIADAIIRLKNDGDLYMDMSKNAKKAFETKFMAKQMSMQIEEIYERII